MAIQAHFATTQGKPKKTNYYGEKMKN